MSGAVQEEACPVCGAALHVPEDAERIECAGCGLVLRAADEAPPVPSAPAPPPARVRPVPLPTRVVFAALAQFLVGVGRGVTVVALLPLRTPMEAGFVLWAVVEVALPYFLLKGYHLARAVALCLGAFGLLMGVLSLSPAVLLFGVVIWGLLGGTARRWFDFKEQQRAGPRTPSTPASGRRASRR